MKKTLTLFLAIYSFAGLSSQTWDTIPQTIKSATQYSEQIKSADLNGDGLNDIVCAYNDENWHAWVSVFLNSGNNSFTETAIQCSETYLFPSFNPMSPIDLADIDNDGDIDIVAAAQGVQIILNDGDGNFADPYYISSIQNEDLFSYYTYAIDIDNDNDKDIAVSYRVGVGGSPRIAFYENIINTNTFVEYDSIIVFAPNEMSVCFNLGDFDNDGDFDVIFNNDGNAFIAENSGGNVFAQNTWTTTYNIGNTSYGYKFLVADYDNDGDWDVINEKSTGLFIFTNNSGFSFDIDTLYNEWDNSFLAIDVDTLSINDTLNIVLSIAPSFPNPNPAPLINFKYMGNNIFARDTIEYDAGTRTISLSDVDSDGYIDIVHDYFDGNEHNLVYFRNTSTPCQPIVITNQPIGGFVNYGSDFTFTIDVSGTSPTYQWYKNDLAIPGAVVNSYTILNADFSDEAFYKCEVENDCTDPLFSDIVELLVVCADTIIITQQPVGGNVGGGSYTLVVEVDDNIDITSYQWYFNNYIIFDGGSFSGATTNELQINPFNPDYDGDYFCKITTLCDTAYTDTVTLTYITAIREIVGSIATIYPNPVHTTFNLKLQSNEAFIKVSTVNGQIERIINITNKVSTIDLSDLQPGFYLISISDKNSTEIFKILKE